MTSYAIKSGSQQHKANTRDAIANRVPFETGGALSGGEIWASVGRLQGAEISRFHDDRDEIDYVVSSYATPIAWHTPKGWYVVAQKFSPTTTTHQDVVRLALSEKGL